MVNATLKYIIAAAMLLGGSMGSASAQIPYCASGKTVIFAGLNWESGDFVTEVLKTLLATGYGCKVDILPGNTVTLEQATADNDVQIFAEEWAGRSEVWNKAVAAGKVKAIGTAIADASEGWFVPEYLVKGDAARGIKPKAPDLQKIEQLSRADIVALFKDPEEPSKGRFLNCPSGWSCEGVNTTLLAAYKLNDFYVNFRPGTGIALDAAISAAYLQGEPVLFYYYGPSAIMDKYRLLKLEEPANAKPCPMGIAQRDAACGFPPVTTVYGVSSQFAGEAPEIIALLEGATFPLAEVNASLSYMADHKASAITAATHFLKTRSPVWSAWVSPEAKAKIEAAVQ